MDNREIIYFAKVKQGAKTPSKDDENMGYDIYACFDDDNFVINPHETVLVPTGIASACDKGYGFILKERGSTGTKGIGQRCGVIDSGYRNEWFVPITNHNEKPIVITKEEYTDALLDDFIVYPYSKAICQALLIPVPETEIIEIEYDELKKMESKRGMGHLGSSGK